MKKRLASFLILPVIIYSIAYFSSDKSKGSDYSVNCVQESVSVSGSPEYQVIPSGAAIGIKIFCDGLLVVNVSENSPADRAGIIPGDRIISANGKILDADEELSHIINISDSVSLKIVRDNETADLSLTPEITDSGKKLGIWVRDSTAGVGTLTFFDPQSSVFATLGHAICDVDTGDIICPKTGSLTKCDIINTTKSVNGAPGELSGVFGENIGKIVMNTENGIYGKLSVPSKSLTGEEMPVATRFEVKTGAAEILADIDGGGIKKYSIEIEDVSKKIDSGNKSLIIHVTDPVLLEKTGGIVQGMSGSPIIQNGKLAGAITHVFINDITRGYGIFAENMLDLSLRLG